VRAEDPGGVLAPDLPLQPEQMMEIVGSHGTHFVAGILGARL
jgi:hypothetical protein